MNTDKPFVDKIILIDPTIRMQKIGEMMTDILANAYAIAHAIGGSELVRQVRPSDEEITFTESFIKITMRKMKPTLHKSRNN